MFFASWPEAVLVSLLGLQLVGIKPKIPYLVLAGLLQALSSYFIRALTIDYGYHTIIQLVVYAVILWLVIRAPYIAAQIATLIGFTCYLALESAVLPLTIKVMEVSMDKIFAEPLLRITAFLPQAIIFLALVVIAKKLDLVLLHINTSSDKADKNEH